MPAPLAAGGADIALISLRRDATYYAITPLPPTCHCYRCWRHRHIIATSCLRGYAFAAAIYAIDAPR